MTRLVKQENKSPGQHPKKASYVIYMFIVYVYLHGYVRFTEINKNNMQNHVERIQSLTSPLSDGLPMPSNAVNLGP